MDPRLIEQGCPECGAPLNDLQGPEVECEPIWEYKDGYLIKFDFTAVIACTGCEFALPIR